MSIELLQTDDVTHVWSVTYHNGDVDDITAAVCERVGGTVDFRDADGNFVGTLHTGVYRSIVRLDALVAYEESDEFEEGLADWEKDILAEDERARAAAEAISRADVTAVFTLTDGRTVKREFQLDNVDEPVMTTILADLDVNDVTQPEDVSLVFEPGERRAVRFRISGRGPVVGSAKPVAVEG